MNFKALVALVTGLLILMTTGQTVLAKTTETQTNCVGRLLVDVPTEFEVMDFGGSINGLKIERLGAGNEKDLQNRIAERIQALEDKKVIEGGDPVIFLGTEDVGGVTVIKHILDTSIMGQITEPWTEEAYVLSDGVIFHLIGTGTKDKLDFYRENMLSVANAIHPRELTEIPSEQGFCLKDAFVALPPDNENIGATFIHPTERSILLRISTVVRVPGGRTLDFSAIEGGDGDPFSIAGFKGKELRLQNKEINLSAMVGQQPTKSTPGYKFTLEYSDSRGDAGSAPVAMKDAETIWGKIVKSIRIKE